MWVFVKKRIAIFLMIDETILFRGLAYLIFLWDVIVINSRGSDLKVRDCHPVHTKKIVRMGVLVV